MPKRSKGSRHIIRLLPSRKILITLLILIILFTCSILVRNYLYNSEEFTIEEVELKGEGIVDSYLFKEFSKIGIGENIFALNIKYIASSIKDNYFEVKDIRIKKVFPNKLIFYIEKREAVALVNSGYYYPVDKEGMILRDVSRTMPEGLPVIKGVHVSKRDIGRKHTSFALVRSLILLEELSKSNILESHNVFEIDASNSRNISFYMDDGLEVKMGTDEFMDKLTRFKKTLEDPDINLGDIRYVDLRFENVIVRPR